MIITTTVFILCLAGLLLLDAASTLGHPHLPSQTALAAMVQDNPGCSHTKTNSKKEDPGVVSKLDLSCDENNEILVVWTTPENKQAVVQGYLVIFFMDLDTDYNVEDHYCFNVPSNVHNFHIHESQHCNRSVIAIQVVGYPTMQENFTVNILDNPCSGTVHPTVPDDGPGGPSRLILVLIPTLGVLLGAVALFFLIRWRRGRSRPVEITLSEMESYVYISYFADNASWVKKVLSFATYLNQSHVQVKIDAFCEKEITAYTMAKWIPVAMMGARRIVVVFSKGYNMCLKSIQAGGDLKTDTKSVCKVCAEHRYISELLYKDCQLNSRVVLVLEPSVQPSELPLPYTGLTSFVLNTSAKDDIVLALSNDSPHTPAVS